MKEEVGSQPAAGRRINPAHPVAKDERRHRRACILVANVENERHRRLAGKEDINIAAEAQVLSALADVEADLRFTLAGIPAVDLQDLILEAQVRTAIVSAAGRHRCSRSIQR